MFGDAVVLALAFVAGLCGGAAYARTFYGRLEKLSSHGAQTRLHALGLNASYALIRYILFCALFLVVHAGAGTLGAIAFTVAGLFSFWYRLLVMRGGVQ